MSLDNETRNYVDDKVKDEIKECVEGKLLKLKLKHFEGRVAEMQTEIKEAKDAAVLSIKEVSKAGTDALKKKNNRLFEVILLLVVIGFNVFLTLR